MKGNLHVRFLGGWRVVTLSGYPVCDQEVHNRTLVTPHKVCEEVSKKETRNHFEPCDVQVSLPRRAEE